MSVPVLNHGLTSNTGRSTQILIFCYIPKSIHRNTNTAQTLDSTEKEKIAAEPMGATNIFCFSCETNILHIISRFYVGIWDILDYLAS